jgi:Agrin NtA domain
VLFSSLIFALILGVFGATGVFACSVAGGMPTQTPYQRLETRVTNSSVIVEGTVVSTESRTGKDYSVVATVKVTKYFKGSGSDEVKISGFGDGGPDCRAEVKVGESYYFFATGNPGSELKAYYFFVYDTVLKVNSSTEQDIIKLVGSPPVAPPKLMFAPEDSTIGLMTLIGLLFLVGGSVFLLILLGRRRTGKRL